MIWRKGCDKRCHHVDDLASQCLRRMLDAKPSQTVIIDEVQKIPRMMDEIHWLIENRGYRFVLSLSRFESKT